MKTVLALAFVSACGVSHDTDDQETSPPVALTGPKSGLPTAMPSAYRLVPVPTGMTFGSSTAAQLVCANTTVVGSQEVSGGQRAIVFDYQALQTTDLGTLGGSISAGRDGNASGTFVGSSTPAMGSGVAFVHRDGVMSELPGIGGNESSAHAINAQGQIVGQAQVPGTGDVDQHAILWQPSCSAALDLGTLDGGYSFARAINNAGVIVGSASVGDGVNSHAVMWGPDHVIVDLGSLGGRFAQAIGLNDRGDVVGSSTLQFDQVSRAFLYTDGAMVNLADLVQAPGWQILQAHDICNNGVIAGNGILDGRSRGFVLIPQ